MNILALFDSILILRSEKTFNNFDFNSVKFKKKMKNDNCSPKIDRLSSKIISWDRTLFNRALKFTNYVLKFIN